MPQPRLINQFLAYIITAEGNITRTTFIPEQGGTACSINNRDLTIKFICS